MYTQFSFDTKTELELYLRDQLCTYYVQCMFWKMYLSGSLNQAR